MVVILSLVLVVVFFLLLFVIILFLFTLFDLFLELPYVGTQRKRIETIMKFANLKEGETVVDLGSGDGRLLIESAKKGAFAIGYEINPFMIAVSIIHAKLEGLASNVEIYKRNLWRADLKVANVIFVYAKRKTMKKFEEFIFKNAQKGTRVVVNTNPFPSKKPLKAENGIFFYKV